ncbi:MAG: hypothetical protein LBS31_13300 [Candidatus Adiutrix sp.]|jgi:hypothetical protein|nr:hypothetical protein [Candidatus Adiutrix sp.]
MSEKTTGFLVEGEWENSYLDIVFGSAVKFCGSSLTTAAAIGEFTGSILLNLSLTLTVGVFLTSDSLITMAPMRLKANEEETTAEEVEVSINLVSAGVDDTSVQANRVAARLNELKTRLERAQVAAARSVTTLTSLASAAVQNEAALTRLGVAADRSALATSSSAARASSESASASQARFSARDLNMRTAHSRAIGDLAISQAQANHSAGLINETSLVTTHV